MPSSSNQYPKGGNKDFELNFNAGDLKPVTPYSEDLKDEYHEAQHALRELRQKEEQIRKRADELEEITHKEDAFTQSRVELVNQIEDYLDILDHEANESQRIARECVSAHQVFHHHLRTLRNLHPDAPDRSDRSVELDHALNQIEAAEQDVTETMPLIDHITGRRHQSKSPATFAPQTRADNLSANSHSGVPTQADFFYWLKAGLAFTLPLMTLAIIVAFIALFLR